MDFSQYPKICQVCKTHVQEDTKHCWNCEKCVLHFDHHCKWLNNCIGRKNYKYFASLLLVFEGLSMSYFSTASIICKGIMEEDSIYESIENMNQPIAAYFVSAIIIAVLTGIAGFIDGQLILFHLFLFLTRQTTYEYIKKKRNRVQPLTSEKKRQVKGNRIEMELEEIYEPYDPNPSYVDLN